MHIASLESCSFFAALSAPSPLTCAAELVHPLEDTGSARSDCHRRGRQSSCSSDLPLLAALPADSKAVHAGTRASNSAVACVTNRYRIDRHRSTRSDLHSMEEQQQRRRAVDEAVAAQVEALEAEIARHQAALAQHNGQIDEHERQLQQLRHTHEQLQHAAAHVAGAADADADDDARAAAAAAAENAGAEYSSASDSNDEQHDPDYPDEGDPSEEESEDEEPDGNDEGDDEGGDEFAPGPRFAIYDNEADDRALDGLPEEDAAPGELREFLAMLRAADPQGAAQLEEDAAELAQHAGDAHGARPAAAAAGADAAGEAGVGWARHIVRMLREALVNERIERRRRAAAHLAQAARAAEETVAAAPSGPPPPPALPPGVHFTIRRRGSCDSSSSAASASVSASAASPTDLPSFDADTLITEVSAIVFPLPSPPLEKLVLGAEVAAGRDPQGIPWANLRRTRAAYRIERTTNYPLLHAEFPGLPATLRAECTEVAAPSSPSFVHSRSVLSIRPGHYHPQLRHLLHATSSADVYAMCAGYTLQHINLQVGPRCTVGGVEEEADHAREEKEHVASVSTSPAAAHTPLEESRRFIPKPTTLVDFGEWTTALTSMLALPDLPLLAVGAMNGAFELRNTRTGVLVKQIAQGGLTQSDNAICNAITYTRSTLHTDLDESGALLPCTGLGPARLVLSNNDRFARVFDLATMETLRDFPEEWAVNYAVCSPLSAPYYSAKILALAGDSHDALLRDVESGVLVSTLRGHANDLFSFGFHPTLPLVATAGQDNSARVFDLRRADKSLYMIPARIAPIRSVAFDPSGSSSSLLMAEGADFLHLLSLEEFDAGGKPTMETLDLFGEITGAAWSPGGERIFVGITDAVYGGVVEYTVAATNKQTRHSAVVDMFA